MKKVSLRNFQLKPTKYFKDLPIKLTRYGKPIATVNADRVNKASMDYINRKLAPKVAEAVLGKSEIKLCKHGSQIGLCKHGCKK